VNRADNKLKKGEAYNLDMLALGIVTGGKRAVLAISLHVFFGLGNGNFYRTSSLFFFTLCPM